MPDTVAQMAGAARLEKGMTTLEIGPATGINLALISRLVGPEHAVGVEIDEALAAACRTALAATGYGDATVVCGDGEQGYAPRAPYWRVLSTAAARRIPHAWVQQTHQGGLIVSPFQTTLCPQGMVVLTVHGNAASGHFSLPLRFMLLRRGRHRHPALAHPRTHHGPLRPHRHPHRPALLARQPRQHPSHSPALNTAAPHQAARAPVPQPGAIGILVDIGLSVGGFVDVLLLPDESEAWPVEGTVADFEIWWADSRQQIRLKPSDARYLRNDFTDFVERWRPSWSSDLGQPVRDPGPVTLDELQAALR